MAATASAARNDHQLCLVMGGGAASIEWTSPPIAVRKLLHDLFSVQPDEALLWVHRQVWSLQEMDIMSKINSQPLMRARSPHGTHGSRRTSEDRGDGASRSRRNSETDPKFSSELSKLPANSGVTVTPGYEAYIREYGDLDASSPRNPKGKTKRADTGTGDDKRGSSSTKRKENRSKTVPAPEAKMRNPADLQVWQSDKKVGQDNRQSLLVLENRPSQLGLVSPRQSLLKQLSPISSSRRNSPCGTFPQPNLRGSLDEEFEVMSLASNPISEAPSLVNSCNNSECGDPSPPPPPPKSKDGRSMDPSGDLSRKGRGRSSSAQLESGIEDYLRPANHRLSVAPSSARVSRSRQPSTCSNRSFSEELLQKLWLSGADDKTSTESHSANFSRRLSDRRLSTPPPTHMATASIETAGSAVEYRNSNKMVVDPLPPHPHSTRPGIPDGSDPLAPIRTSHFAPERELSNISRHTLISERAAPRGSVLASLRDDRQGAAVERKASLAFRAAGSSESRESGYDNSGELSDDCLNGWYRSSDNEWRQKRSEQSNWINLFTGTRLDKSQEASVTESMGTDIPDILDDDWEPVWCENLLNDVSLMTWPRLFWELSWLSCVVYELWFALFVLVFWPERNFPEGFEIVASAVLIFFAMDIVLNCFTAFKEDGELISNPRIIVDRYLKSWFFYDFGLAVSDFILLLSGNKLKVLQALKLARVVSLWRLRVDAEIMQRVFGDKSFKRMSINCCLLNLALLILSHINGAIWASIQEDTWMPATASTAFDRYLSSLYRAHATLISGFTVQVSSPSHWLFSILIGIERTTLITVCFFYMMKTMLIHGSADVEQDPLEDDVLAFLKRRDVPSMGRTRVVCNLREACKARKLQRCFDVLQGQSLPLEIRQIVAEMLWANKLRSLGLVKEVMNYHSMFSKELMLTIFGEFVPSRTTLFRSSEPSHAAYHVISGVLEVKFTEDEDDPMDDYTSGMWAGEKAVVNFELRRGETVACKTLAELMVLSAMEFRKLLIRFDLQEVVEDLIKLNLWMGFCGRCGLFGDHFKRDCPLLKLRRENRGLIKRVVFGSPQIEQQLVGKDLRVFLQDYDLERLVQAMHNHGIQHLNHLSREKIDELIADPDVTLTDEEEMILNNSISTFRKKHASGAVKIMANSGDSENHLVFISHYKVEAGTEATLMQNDILQLLAEDSGLPGQDLASPVFLDSEDLQDLEELQEHVKRSHNLILLLTNGVLKRPWVLVEVVTAMTHGVNVLPVEIQRRDVEFTYPDEDYYERLLKGEELDQSSTDLLLDEGFELDDLCKALRQVFKRIAVPFSPHKTATVRKAELQDILKRCQIKKGRISLKNADTIVQICRPSTNTINHITGQSPRETPRSSNYSATSSPAGSTQMGRGLLHRLSRKVSATGSASSDALGQRVLAALPGSGGTKSNLLQVGASNASPKSHGYGIRMMGASTDKLQEDESPEQSPEQSPDQRQASEGSTQSSESSP